MSDEPKLDIWTAVDLVVQLPKQPEEAGLSDDELFEQRFRFLRDMHGDLWE